MFVSGLNYQNKTFQSIYQIVTHCNSEKDMKEIRQVTQLLDISCSVSLTHSLANTIPHGLPGEGLRFMYVYLLQHKQSPVVSYGSAFLDENQEFLSI